MKVAKFLQSGRNCAFCFKCTRYWVKVTAVVCKQWLSAAGQRSSSVAVGTALRWAKCATRFETVLTGAMNPSRNAVSQNLVLPGAAGASNCFLCRLISTLASYCRVSVNHTRCSSDKWHIHWDIGYMNAELRCKYAAWQLNSPLLNKLSHTGLITWFLHWEKINKMISFSLKCRTKLHNVPPCHRRPKSARFYSGIHTWIPWLELMWSFGDY